jgi:hypothetical protein
VDKEQAKEMKRIFALLRSGTINSQISMNAMGNLTALYSHPEVTNPKKSLNSYHRPEKVVNIDGVTAKVEGELAIDFMVGGKRNLIVGTTEGKPNHNERASQVMRVSSRLYDYNLNFADGRAGYMSGGGIFGILAGGIAGMFDKVEASYHSIPLIGGIDNVSGALTVTGLFLLGAVGYAIGNKRDKRKLNEVLGMLNGEGLLATTGSLRVQGEAIDHTANVIRAGYNTILRGTVENELDGKFRDEHVESLANLVVQGKHQEATLMACQYGTVDNEVTLAINQDRSELEAEYLSQLGLKQIDLLIAP